MRLDYYEVELYGHACTRVLGVKEHGASMSFRLTDDAAEEIYNKFSGVSCMEGTTLNIYADGYINLSTSEYDYGKEEFTETEDLEFCGAGLDIIRDALSDMLNESPVRTQDDGIRFLETVQEIVDYLKTK